MANSIRQYSGLARQIAAMPWRHDGGHLQVLLVTSRTNRRWMLPKGWPMSGKSDAEAAAQEALEEAGVVGRVAPRAIGSYRYIKDYVDKPGVPAQALVFPLQVDRLLDEWPEQAQRQREWFTFEEARHAVEVPDLARLLSDLGRSWRPLA
jgi:8-oxo-dGTP pyrophosphatase MutT (NUDIX family)